MEKKRLSKNEYLARNREICKYNSYVISGSFKAFYIHPDTGKEEILFFDASAFSQIEAMKQVPKVGGIVKQAQDE